MSRTIATTTATSSPFVARDVGLARLPENRRTERLNDPILAPHADIDSHDLHVSKNDGISTANNQILIRICIRVRYSMKLRARIGHLR